MHVFLRLALVFTILIPGSFSLGQSSHGDSVELDTTHHHHDHALEFHEAHHMEMSESGELVSMEPDTNGAIGALPSVKNPWVRKIMLDSAYWMSVDSFFCVFDSLNVNPYDYDGVNYKDTNYLQLFGVDMRDSSLQRDWSLPLKKEHYVTSKFGMRRYRWHYGTDLRVAIGDTIASVFDGVVRISKYNSGGYGNYVMIRHHNGLESLYGHLSKSLVKVGQEVKAGELIGYGGNTGRSTGPHLHFEVRYHGNAFDPELLFHFDSTETIEGPVFAMMPGQFEYIREMRKVVYHKIRSGDTLSGIAVRYHTTVTTLCRLNGISRSTILRIGRRLRVR